MKFWRETWLFFVRSLLSTLRFPIWAVIGLFQPLCYLFLFAPLLNTLTQVPGFPSGGTITVFTPGILIMMAILSTVFAGFGLIAELNLGIIERFRVTPINRLALLLGMALRDVLLLLIQSLLLILIALPLGLKVDPLGLLLSLVLVALLGLCLACCSYALALALKDANALSSLLNMLTLPIFLLSGIMLPLTLAPTIIRKIANFNPFAYAVNAARQLFNGHISDPVVLQSFLMMGVLTLLAIIWARASFNRPVA